VSLPQQRQGGAIGGGRIREIRAVEVFEPRIQRDEVPAGIPLRRDGDQGSGIHQGNGTAHRGSLD